MVDEDLRVILPQDYVNYVRISIEHDGVLFKLTENQTINYATRYQQNDSGTFLFTLDGDLIEEQSELDRIRIEGDYTIYYGPGYWNGRYGYLYADNWYFGYTFGGFYGMDTSNANANPTTGFTRSAEQLDHVARCRDLPCQGPRHLVYG
jgi:hypothetical protein